ncbi:hypothetical protein CABS01_03537 [Colletotrichum abscissum]|uniref:uncharacterized protein n=1 Tax=Colletotrichum abscissum TaxID=1671311 RepID=UPI0027D4D0CD|nr:uncharacterized protein CABS01_03537 [Colletotrichum abscissum]KAK1475260.1 hypothetical protein CABS01_03537 [Colletotrichum abscissum]
MHHRFESYLDVLDSKSPKGLAGSRSSDRITRWNTAKELGRSRKARSSEPEPLLRRANTIAHTPATRSSREERTLEERRLIHRERRTLKESGDYLGVTGINPVTGELDVETPSTTSFSSASLTIDQKLEARHKSESRRTRRGAELLTEEVTKKLQQREEQRFARKDREKEAIRQAQRNVQWQRHRQQWSSAKEPVLSPIAQSNKSVSTRGSEAKDARYLPEQPNAHRLGMGHTDPKSHLPKHIISEENDADSSDTVIRTPQSRRSSMASTAAQELGTSGRNLGGDRRPTQLPLPFGNLNSPQSISEESRPGHFALPAPVTKGQSQKGKAMEKELPPIPQGPQKTVSFLGQRRPETEPGGRQALRAVSNPMVLRKVDDQDPLGYHSREFSRNLSLTSGKIPIRHSRTVSASANLTPINLPRDHILGETYPHPALDYQQQTTFNRWEVRQLIPLIRDMEALDGEVELAVAPLVVAYRSLMQTHELNDQQAAKTRGPPITANISPFESLLTSQIDQKSPPLQENSLAREYIQALGDNLCKVTQEPPIPKSLTFEDRATSPGRMEVHEGLICQRAVGKMEALKTKAATTPITTIIGCGQGLSQSSLCQEQPERRVSESWSMLQNRRVSRQCDEQMSTSTEDISTEKVRHLKTVKIRTQALAPKGSQTPTLQHRNDAIHKVVEKYSARNLADSDKQESQAENLVTPHMFTSTSPLTVLEPATQQGQSKIASTGAARAALANSGNKTAETRKQNLSASGTPRSLPTSLRKPPPDSVPSRRLRNKFKIMRFSNTSPSKSTNTVADGIEAMSSRKSSQTFCAMKGRNDNLQDTPTANQQLSAASQARLKAGCSTSTTLVNSNSEGGDTGGRLRRGVLSKRVLKCATDGKQIAGSAARWYWKAISPCFDPTSPARKRLDVNKSTWTDVGRFLVALSSGFALLATAVRIAQGIAWVMQMVQGLLGGLIAILGS